MAEIFSFPAPPSPSDRMLDGIEQMRELISHFSVEPATLTPIEVCRFVLVATLAELEPEQRPELAKELRRVASALMVAHRHEARAEPPVA